MYMCVYLCASVCLCLSCRRCWLCAYDNSAFPLRRVATSKHPTCPTAHPSPLLSSHRADNGSVRPLPCPSKDSCNGSSSAAGGIGGCELGHEGPFCSLCSTNFTRFSENAACQPCPSGEDEGGALAALLAIIAGGLVAVVLYALFNHKIPKGVLKPFINGSQCKFTARRNIHTQS